LEESGGGTIVNLASKEYWSAVEGRLPPGIRVIEIDFRRARPHWPALQHLQRQARPRHVRPLHLRASPHRSEALKSFDSDGYRFDPAGSDEHRWRFLREPAA
jgi:cytoplasmic iron level regulating protein YaaA (DUF328/UPF0246 family)